MTGDDLIVLAGTGSTDGYQEYAHRLLLAQATERRAIDLDNTGTGPTHDFRVAAEAEVAAAEAAFAQHRELGTG